MKPILLCLHGWGGSKESFTELRKALRGTDIDILTPDLPGFGDEPEPPEVWGIDEYAQWVEEWLQRRVMVSPSNHHVDRHRVALRQAQDDTMQTTQLFLLGHSLGGQIAVKLALRGNPPIRHLFLCAPAAIRPRFSLRRTTGYIIAKCGRALLRLPALSRLQPLLRALLYRLMRVHDYERASPTMQKIMLRVTHQSLENELHRIAIPTDIFWGLSDRTTPVQKGILMQKLIPGSTLHTFPATRHAVHRDRAQEITAVIRQKLVSH